MRAAGRKLRPVVSRGLSLEIEARPGPIAIADCGATIVAWFALLFASPLPAGAEDKDCSDFSSQKAAQQFFESHNPSEDPHFLDGDDDGKACETLPCPCADDGGGGGGDGNGGGGNKPSKGIRTGTVSEVTDGDTIEVRIGARNRDVRIVGIDTPEVFFGAECGGAEASASMNGLLTAGQRVKLIRDRSQDSVDAFGRLLRYVERKGQDVGRAQIAAGWAEVFVFESPFKRLSSYQAAEDAASSQGLGVWGLCGGDFHKPL